MNYTVTEIDDRTANRDHNGWPVATILVDFDGGANPDETERGAVDEKGHYVKRMHVPPDPDQAMACIEQWAADYSQARDVAGDDPHAGLKALAGGKAVTVDVAAVLASAEARAAAAEPS